MERENRVPARGENSNKEQASNNSKKGSSKINNDTVQPQPSPAWKSESGWSYGGRRGSGKGKGGTRSRSKVEG